jgi:TonB family protein
MARAAFTVSLLLSIAAFAQNAPAIALLVNESSIDAAQLADAIGATDPLTRATAARVATVRGITDALPRLREVVTAENNAEAAREQIRALCILGTEEDIDLVAKQLPRFPASIDLDFSEAIARRGAPYATALYLRYAPALRRSSPYVQHALWARAPLANVTASKLIAANDVRALRSLFDALATSGMTLDPGVLSIALEAPSTEIRSAATWYVVDRQADVPAAALTEREGASVEERFGREVLRRMGGAQKEDREEWLAWLRSSAGRARVWSKKAVQQQLTAKEQKAWAEDKPAWIQRVPSAFESQPIAVSPFRLSPELPTGLSEKLFAHTRCNSAWIGSGSVAVDRAGRVQSAELSRVYTIGECKTALRTMLRLSLADPTTLNASLVSDDLQFVKPPGNGCFDEAPVDGFGTGDILRAGGDVVAPVVIQRVEPDFPRSARQNRGAGSAVVVMEAVITRTGCVRDIQIISQSHSGDLNSAAVSALSKWKFKPGTLDGQPVDVLFTLTISFRTF